MMRLHWLGYDAWSMVIDALEEPREILCLLGLSRAFRANEDLALNLLTIDGFKISMLAPCLQTQSICVRAIRDTMEISVKELRTLRASMPSHLANSPAVLVASIKQHPSLLAKLGSHFGPTWRKDRELVKSLLEASCSACILLDFPTFARDSEIVELAVRRQGTLALKWTPAFQSDRKMALLALEKDPLWTHNVSSVLWEDPTFIPEAVQHNHEVLRFAGPWLNHHWALEAARVFPQVLCSLPLHLRRDPLIYNVALDSDPMTAASLPTDLCTFDVMKRAILKDPLVFATMPRWVTNRALALLALSLEGLLLGQRLVRETWANDEEAVLVAVKQNGLALEFASMDLRFDRDVLQAALRQNGLALAFAHNCVRHIKWLVAIAVRQNPHALAFSTRCQSLKPKPHEVVSLALPDSAAIQYSFY
jgi:hypothetical protein